jgi:DNA-3-methyladenine glycosylase II
MRRAISHLEKADPTLGVIIRRVGPCRILYMEPDFEAVARSIVFQQLHGKAARAIFSRLKHMTDASSRMTPAAVLTLNLADMRGLGLSERKAKYLQDLAEKTQAGLIDFSRLASLSDDAVVEHLTRVKGVGVWTAQMFLLFALRRPDVLAAGDLGIRSAIRKAYRFRKLPTPARVVQVAKPWHPYCSVACWYLWRSVDTLV